MTQLIIDSDTHVIESEAMWDLMDKNLYARRPVIIKVPPDTVSRDRDAFWLIDGRVVPKPAGRGAGTIPTPSAMTSERARSDTSQECRELSDVNARLRDMDRLGIDLQVVYPSLFLRPVTEDPHLEIGLCRAYNEWMAGVAGESSNMRIRWVVVPPLASMSDAISEIRIGKEEGAVGVFMRGIEAAGSVADPYFFPLFEECRLLSMPICIHSGIGSFSFADQFKLEVATFTTSLPVPMAFRDLVVNRVPERFPGLRFGFIEAGSSWLPYVFQQLGRRRKALWAGPSSYYAEEVSETAEMMRKNELYVACMLDDDLPYILRQAAEDRILVGSDYTHIDPAFEAGLVEVVGKWSSLSPDFAENVLSLNSARFYGLDSSK